LKDIIKISIPEARYMALKSQLLLNSHKSETKGDLLNIIEQLGYVQIDTISVVERAHRHILWTRFPAYKEEMLTELIDKDKKVFEYWDHAAAFMPMKNFRYAFFRKRKFTKEDKNWRAWSKKNKKIIRFVLDRIRAEGALQSRDFEHPPIKGRSWWEWKPSKHALDYLFHTGELAAKARINFQKVYDLPERVLPAGLDTTEPTDEEHSEHLIMNAIRAHGFIAKKEIVYLKYHSRTAFEKTLKKLLDEKIICRIRIDNLQSEYFSTELQLNTLNKQNTTYTHTHILSPFDNLIIQRKRLNDLFNFEYIIECYIPAHKRKYGYYCMPVLNGDKFIGKIDLKSDRINGVLNVLNFFPEKGIKKPDAKKLIKNKLNELALFAGCRKVKNL
jgi:uncharacterized protein